MSTKTKGSILVMVVAILLTLVAGLVLNSQTGTYEEAIFAQQEEIETLNTKITLAKANAAGHEQSVIQSVTGIDVERKYADDAVALAFAKKVMTWGNYDEYVQMRKDIMAEYNISGSSMFMINFLPSRPQGYTPDVNVSSHFDTIDTVCYSINEETGIYSYMAEVRCVTSGELGGSATVLSIFMYSIDADGNISNLTAYNV